MCGRYAVIDEEDIIEMREIINEINQRYRGKEDLSFMKKGEIYPTDTVPVIIPNNTKSEAALMKWGFTGFDGNGVIINARSETANEKNMFKSAMNTRRCLIPANGFYEWTHKKQVQKPSDKLKYWLHLENEPVMYMAGLFSSFVNKVNNQAYNSFVILTAPANEYVNSIHDRMPVIVPKNMRENWLYDKNSSMYLFEHNNPILRCEKAS